MVDPDPFANFTLTHTPFPSHFLPYNPPAAASRRKPRDENVLNSPDVRRIGTFPLFPLSTLHSAPPLPPTNLYKEILIGACEGAAIQEYQRTHAHRTPIRTYEGLEAKNADIAKHYLERAYDLFLFQQRESCSQNPQQTQSKFRLTRKPQQFQHSTQQIQQTQKTQQNEKKRRCIFGLGVLRVFRRFWRRRHEGFRIRRGDEVPVTPDFEGMKRVWEKDAVGKGAWERAFKEKDDWIGGLRADGKRKDGRKRRLTIQEGEAERLLNASVDVLPENEARDV